MKAAVITGMTLMLFMSGSSQAQTEHRCRPVYVGEAKIHILASHHTSCAIARAAVKKGWYIQAHKARLGVFRYNITVRHHKYGIKAVFLPPSKGGGRMYARFANRKQRIFCEAHT